MNEQVQPSNASPISVLRNDLHNMEAQFKAALPAHIPVERFLRVVMTAVQGNPDLVNKVDRRTLWGAAIKAAQDGLLPDGREGAIVAYGTQAQWMPMIAGIRKKVRNSGEIATWDVHAVHERDDFAFELGDEPFIKHRPNLTGDPGALIAAYSIATLKSGEKSREVMSISAIEKIRSRSKAKNSGPWVTDYEEMAKKTVARRHSKVLPMSTDLDDLLRRDDDLYDMKAAKDEAPERLKNLSTRLDALAHSGQTAIDATPENGVVIDQNGETSSEQPSATQGGASTAHPGPAADGKPAPAQESPKHPEAGAGAMQPTTANEYAAYFHAWLAKTKDAEQAEKLWKGDKALRAKCKLDAEMFEALEDELLEKIAALKGKK